MRGSLYGLIIKGRPGDAERFVYLLYAYEVLIVSGFLIPSFILFLDIMDEWWDTTILLLTLYIIIRIFVKMTNIF
jgi:hypothetical protein